MLLNNNEASLRTSTFILQKGMVQLLSRIPSFPVLTKSDFDGLTQPIALCKIQPFQQISTSSFLCK